MYGCFSFTKLIFPTLTVAGSQRAPRSANPSPSRPSSETSDATRMTVEWMILGMCTASPREQRSEWAPPYLFSNSALSSLNCQRGNDARAHAVGEWVERVARTGRSRRQVSTSRVAAIFE